jgi:hypothetical protein
MARSGTLGQVLTKNDGETCYLKVVAQKREKYVLRENFSLDSFEIATFSSFSHAGRARIGTID